MTVAAKPPVKSSWLVPAGLIVLSIIPALAGIVRLAQLGGGGPISPDLERFAGAPIPIVVHIVCSLFYSILGAFQFSPRFRQRHPRWHRVAGKLLLAGGMLAALSGIWMTLIYPIVKPEGLGRFDDLGLYVVRLTVGLAMAGFIVLGFLAIRGRDIQSHRAWMLRSYALGMGAGTQVFTHIPMFVFPSLQVELARTLCMAAGWVINLVMAEWLIARGKRLRAV